MPRKCIIRESNNLLLSRFDFQIPGSNLYFACWCCFLSAFNLPFRWKAAQAMNFARAREEQEQREIEGREDDSDFDDDDDNDA